MNTHQRKSSPKVIGGKVQKKNNWVETPDYYNTAQRLPVIDRRRPGPLFRHVLKQKDILTFIDILPDWVELSRGLNAVVLAPGNPTIFGYHTRGVVHVCAWDKNIWITLSQEGYEQERHYLDRAGVPCVQVDDEWTCKFTESTAKGHQLLVTLLHELGHHHDRMTTRFKNRASRGEAYAEEYARKYADLIWDRYQDAFGLF